MMGNSTAGCYIGKRVSIRWVTKLEVQMDKNCKESVTFTYFVSRNDNWKSKWKCTMWMHKHKVKHRTRGTQGHELYFAYLPLVAVRDPATSEVWRCFGFPVEASLDSGSDSAKTVSALQHRPGHMDSPLRWNRKGQNRFFFFFENLNRLFQLH